MKKPSMGINPAGSDYLSRSPLGIHLLILAKLDYVDFTRFGAVCKAWRSIASAARQSPFFRLHQVPWLIKGASGRRKLPKLLNRKIFYELELFRDSFYMHGTFEGWLLLSKCGNITTGKFLLDPITRQRISLPKTPNSFEVFVVLPHQSADGMEVVAYSPDDSFYRWRSQDKHWTKIGRNRSISSISHMIYHKGSIYAINDHSNISSFHSTIIIDMGSHTPSIYMRSHPSFVGYISNTIMLRHLVECDGELLMVIRSCLFNQREATLEVSVFKYNPVGKQCWEEVKSIGEKYALFVRKYRSNMAIDVSTNTSFRPNCVYLLEYDYDSGQGQGIRFFDLAKNGFGISMPYSWKAWPPTWFIPKLT